MEDSYCRGTGSKGPRRRSEPAGPRELAYEILLRVERAGAYATVLLERGESRLDDARDAALVHELVLGVLRRQAGLDHALARVASRPPAEMDPQVRVALRIGAYSLLYLDRVPDFAAVDSAVELIRRDRKRHGAGGFVNGVLRSIARHGPSLLPPPPESGNLEGLALFHSHPLWWVERQVGRLGWGAASELLACDNRPAPTVLRPNRRRTTSEDLRGLLAREGVETESCRFVPGALRVSTGRIPRIRALREGLAWVQDEAAQLVPLLFGSRLGPRVADLCAAPGGKAMQLAESLGPADHLVAVDRHFGRLKRLVGGARRAGVQGLSVVQADAAARSAPFGVRFDQVLLDAPCSGTGTLRRHPEIRWRLAEADLARLASRQTRLLDAAARLTAPGGRLVYSVCSLEPEEGESVVRAFLETHDRFRRADPRSVLPPACHVLLGPRGSLRTSPAVEGLDGFFAALLVRDGAPRGSRLPDGA